MKNNLKRFWKFVSSNEALLIMLFTVFAASLVTANVVASKLFSVGFNMFGSPVEFNVGTFAYALTFLVSNIISYKYGAEKAKLAILGGFAAQIVATILIVILQLVPAVDANVQGAYVTLIGQNWVFVLASLTAYIVSQLANAYVFNKLTKLFNKKGVKGVWNVVSTGAGQLLDTLVFDLIAFGLGFGWLWKGMGVALINMVIATWVIKCIVALVYTPIFYFLTIKRSK